MWKVVYFIPPLIAMIISNFKISSNYVQNIDNEDYHTSKGENEDRICNCFNGIISLVSKDIGAFKFSIILGVILVIGIQLMGGAFGFIDLAFYGTDFSTATLDNYCNESIPHFVVLCISDCLGALITSILFFFVIVRFPPQKFYQYLMPIICVLYSVIIILTQIYLPEISKNIYLQVCFNFINFFFINTVIFKQINQTAHHSDCFIKFTKFIFPI